MDTIGSDWAKDDALQIHSRHADGHLTLTVLGAVALPNLEALAAALAPSALHDTRRVTVDLRRASFLDSSGLALLVDVSKRLRSPIVPRAPRVLVTPGRQPDRILKLGSFDKILEIGPGDDGDAEGLAWQFSEGAA